LIYIEKVVKVRKHLANIRKILNVHTYLEMLHILHKTQDSDPPRLRLSLRGKEVFELTVKGFGNKQIGECLGMSISGVRRHKEKMLLHNDCKAMLELIAKYYGMDGANPEANHSAD
jgi:DNA-binding CsgD family transcriptional regulator